MSARIALALALAAAPLACGSDPADPPLDQRRELLVNLADAVVLPTVRAFADASPALVASTAALCADPSPANQLAAQETWRQARVPWKRAEALGFGPIADLRIDASVDFWPLRVTDVENELASDGAVSRETVAALGVTRKGMPVIEYLLWGELDRLHEDGAANRSCDYLAALASVTDADAQRLRDAWEPSGGNFRDELVTAGDGSAAYSSLAEPISDAANAIFIAVELVEGEKLAEPLGKRNGGVARPEAVESPYSDNSLADLESAMAGVRSAYTAGGAGVSFSSVVTEIDAALGADVLAELARCESAVAAIPPPLSTAVETAPQTVAVAFECAKDLLRLLKTDVAGVLGVTPTFGDVDGD